MKNIIVTVTDRQKRFMFDMEVPTDMVGKQLAVNVMEVLNECDLDLRFDAEYHCFYLNRQGCVLSDKDTLASAGVWNGDYITVISRM